MRLQKAFGRLKIKRRLFLLGIAVALGLIIFTRDALQLKTLAQWNWEHREVVKAVVVTMFETDNDTGDDPGEFQFWVERENLNQVYSLPAAHRGIRTNGQGLIAIVTGIGTANATASIMALGTDPRFDLTKAYWLVAGIAGIDPNDASVGSAAWAEWVVDADLAHEIDAREIPPIGRMVICHFLPNNQMQHLWIIRERYFISTQS